jgi:hypothetical protein
MALAAAGIYLAMLPVIGSGLGLEKKLYVGIPFFTRCADKTVRG